MGNWTHTIRRIKLNQIQLNHLVGTFTYLLFIRQNIIFPQRKKKHSKRSRIKVTQFLTLLYSVLAFFSQPRCAFVCCNYIISSTEENEKKKQHKTTGRIIWNRSHNKNLPGNLRQRLGKPNVFRSEWVLMKSVKGQTQRITEQSEDERSEPQLMKWKGMEENDGKNAHESSQQQREEEKKTSKFDSLIIITLLLNKHLNK